MQVSPHTAQAWDNAPLPSTGPGAPTWAAPTHGDLAASRGVPPQWQSHLDGTRLPPQGATWTLLRQCRLPSCLRWWGPHQQRPLRPRRHFCFAPYAGWLTVHVRPHQREVCPLARGVMSQPLSSPLQTGLRLLPPPLPAALSGHLTTSFAARGQQGNGLTTFRRWNRMGGLGRVSPPVVRHLRRGSSESLDLTTCLLAQA